MLENILIVCIGNICRSPMAEAILKNKLKEKEVESAGINALVGHDIDSKAKEALMKNEIDFGTHEAKKINSDLLQWSHLVLVMEKEQVQKIVSRFPESNGKVFLIGKWVGREIPDPYKQTQVEFDHVYELLAESIDGWLPYL